MKRLFPIVLSVALVSCFHKDTMNDRADDVEQALLYSGKDGKFIITKEQIFQATSKESNGGVTNISGYAEYRITSYDLSTGNQTGRVEMGEGIEKAFIILGITPGKLWVYSIDPELGFHCRDPKTLNVINDQNRLLANGALKGFQFAQPEWVKLSQFYGWNADNGMLMITDMMGYHYYYDPEKNALAKTDDKMPDHDWSDNQLNSTGYFCKEVYVSFSGDVRKKLQYRYEDSTASFSYVSPEFVMDNDPARLAIIKKQYVDSLKAEQNVINDTLEAIYRRFPVLKNDVMLFNAKTLDEMQAASVVRDLKRHTDDLGREAKRLEERQEEMFSNPLLSEWNGDFFIVHATNVSDTARMQITRVSLNGRTFTEMWSATLNDFYFDPQKANSKGAFETVFSEGDPQFRFQWFDMMDGKLVIISQLQMVCIDVKSGKKLWSKPL